MKSNRPLCLLILETGVRPGEAVSLKWADVYLQPAVHAELGYIAIREGKSRNAKRNLSLTARAAELLQGRKAGLKSDWVFPGDSPEAAILGTSLDHQHDAVRTALKLPVTAGIKQQHFRRFCSSKKQTHWRGRGTYST